MQELLRTTDPVLLSFARACLDDAGIGHAVLDHNISLVEGSMAIFPQRLVVVESDFEAARSVCRAAGIDAALLASDPMAASPKEPASGWLDSLRGLLTAR